MVDPGTTSLRANPSTYQEIFDARGDPYHDAMSRYPRARDAEFRALVELADVRPGHHVADVPCGGGYLASHLPAGIRLYPIDSSDTFSRRFAQDHHAPLLCCPITAIPLPEGALDRIISVAGLHHVADRRPFWRECARLLRRDGVLVVGDVSVGSRVARFLEGTVDRHTETGHRGTYFDEATVAELEAAGFRVDRARPQRIAWCAADRTALADFCRRLFGLQGIDNAQLADALAQEVGVRDTADGVELDWELMLFRATRR